MFQRDFCKPKQGTLLCFVQQCPVVGFVILFVILCLPLLVSDVDYTVTALGLQRDQPPAVGDVTSLAVVILSNDNVEGILEFREDFVNVTGKIHEPSNASCNLSYILSIFSTIVCIVVL